jgi:hypothetical protein
MLGLYSASLDGVIKPVVNPETGKFKETQKKKKKRLRVQL